MTATMEGCNPRVQPRWGEAPDEPPPWFGAPKPELVGRRCCAAGDDGRAAARPYRLEYVPIPTGKWCHLHGAGRLLLVCLCLGLFSVNAAEKFKNTDCLDCHLDPATTRKVDGKIVPLLFPTNSFQKSVHSMLD